MVVLQHGQQIFPDVTNHNKASVFITHPVRNGRSGFIHISRYDPQSIKERFGDDDEQAEEEEEPVELQRQGVTLESFTHPGSTSLVLKQSGQTSWQDMVQSYHFRDFEGLEEFMLPLKDKILKRHAPTLRLVHENFREIVQEIVDSRNFYQSGLGHHDTEDGAASSSSPSEACSWSSKNKTEVALFATPNIRLKRGTYATFLHSDAVYPSTSVSTSDSNSTNTVKMVRTGPRAMLNIWMSLGDTPIPNFPLCFYECSRKDTTFAENKLYYQALAETGHQDDSEPLRMMFDPQLEWGSFLCFVAGQPESDDRVLLHGAVDMMPISTNDAGLMISTVGPTQKKGENMLGREEGTQRIPIGPFVPHKQNGAAALLVSPPMTATMSKRKQKNGCSREEPRKSLEMRYVV